MTEEFLSNVASHKMTVLLDNGVYRHLKFENTANHHMEFEIVTWPDSLCINGMGTWTFCDSGDMFNFLNHVNYSDPGSGLNSATFGEIMCTTYQAFGAAGLVTSGAARDLDQVRRIGFPAFSNGVICSHGYSHIVDLHCAVRVGGLTIHAGDLIHADTNGVATIPLEIAGEIAGAAAEFVQAESIVLDYLKTGSVGTKHFGEARRGMMDAQGALGKRLRSRRL